MNVIYLRFDSWMQWAKQDLQSFVAKQDLQIFVAMTKLVLWKQKLTSLIPLVNLQLR